MLLHNANDMRGVDRLRPRLGDALELHELGVSPQCPLDHDQLFI
jgi:hypothetical protein